MKKSILFSVSFIGLSFLFTESALAVCPVCTVAVGAGVGLSRWLGIDDLITGLWIGGLVVSMIIWTESWFDKKNIKFRFRSTITFLGFCLLTFVPLYFTGLIANPANAIFSTWLDKLLLGVIIGGLVFWLGVKWYALIKEKNDGHAQFPFQKVVMPISPLIILSVVFYFLVK